MALFKLNNGEITELKIDNKNLKTKIFVSLDVTPESNSIKLGGFSDIELSNFVSKNLIFMDHPIGFGFELDMKILTVFADASKFRIKDSSSDPSTVPITCKLTIEAGDTFLESYIIDDRSQCTISSSFEFKIKFTK